MTRKLSAEQIRPVVDPASLGIRTTQDARPVEGIIAQPRATAALQFGLDIRQPGFNVFVAGVAGTGRLTAVRSFLEERSKAEPRPDDWCYVHNFKDPYRPRALRLGAGQGRELAADMRVLIERIRREIPRVFESDEYAARRDAITQEFNRRREQLITRFGERAQQAGFFLQATEFGFVLIPMMGGQPLSDQAFLALPEPVRESIRQRRELLEAELKEVLKEIRRLEREAHEQLHQLDRQAVLGAIGGLFEDLIEKYQNNPGVVDYLKDVQEDIVQNWPLFRAQPHVPAPAMPPGMPVAPALLPFRKYEVNVLVDNSETVGAPVVIEDNPTYQNLFGRIEREPQFGVLYTDQMMIHPGSLHRANGGYLVIPVEELLLEPFAWPSLKRALRTRQVDIEDLTEKIGFVAVKTLHPEPIPLDVKVILIGTPLLYQLLYLLDEDFGELFKVKAEFDTLLNRDDSAHGLYTSFLCMLTNKENLKPLDATGVAKVIEYGSRLAEDQQRLSTRFGLIADVVREAHFQAEREGSQHVTAEHVRKALDFKVYRSNLIEERIREMIARNVLLVDTVGEKVGQVNGLSVVMLGDYAFGRPSRITATIALGREGVVDIEREARLGGPVHTKGVLILSGYLASKYAQDKPLSLAARLVFEQSYSLVEGDSASAAELFALLSAVSGLPLKQSIAVTGSVNQRGEIQAIGGVNEKIEGFFDVCRVKGLTGEQGVIIPEANVQHLVLREDVVEAVREGKFHIWAIRTVDEGMEILTGVPAGERGPDGKYPEGTVNYLVDKRLAELARALQTFGREERETPRKEEEPEREPVQAGQPPEPPPEG